MNIWGDKNVLMQKLSLIFEMEKSFWEVVLENIYANIERNKCLKDESKKVVFHHEHHLNA